MLVDLRDSEAEVMCLPLKEESEINSVVMVIAVDRGKETERSLTFIMTQKQLDEIYEGRNNR